MIAKTLLLAGLTAVSLGTVPAAAATADPAPVTAGRADGMRAAWCQQAGYVRRLQGSVLSRSQSARCAPPHAAKPGHRG